MFPRRSKDIGVLTRFDYAFDRGLTKRGVLT
jgi:hypothetical protein